MKPFKLTPYFKETIWGGNSLKTLFNKPLPNDSIGESWEVSTRSEGESKVQGIPFGTFFAEHKAEIMGADFQGDFPLLVKLIDAHDKLSVQVHPSDENSKTEMWHILSAEPGAGLIVGFKEDITRENLIQSAENGTLEDSMNFVPVAPGDSFFIPAGLVHAIGKGIVLLEIQQNSDTTYRLYDYNRGREIHVRQAAECACLEKYAPQTFPEGCLASCEHFQVFRKALPFSLCGFSIIFARDGRVSAGDLTLEKGECAIIPASAGEISLSGEGTAVYVKL